MIVGVILAKKRDRCKPEAGLMCVKLSGDKAASSNVFLASVGARQRTDGASLYSFWARMYNVANVKR